MLSQSLHKGIHSVSQTCSHNKGQLDCLSHKVAEICSDASLPILMLETRFQMLLGEALVF